MAAKLPIALKIADFGIGCDMKDHPSGKIKRRAGTRQYMAKEQHMSDSEYCPFKADMYAVGVVLFRLVFKSYPLASIEMKRQMVEN